MFLQAHVSELLLFLISYIIHQYGFKKNKYESISSK